MKFKTSSIPSPSIGVSYAHVKEQVVPDQSLGLREILVRFTRGESLPVSHETSEGIQDDDLEKLKYADLVDRHEYIDKMKSVQALYEKQEALRRKKKAEKPSAQSEDDGQAK